jgi:hypothetical protein
MDLHQNARLSFRSREALAKKIMIERLTVNAASAGVQLQPKNRHEVAPTLSHSRLARFAGSFLATAP